MLFICYRILYMQDKISAVIMRCHPLCPVKKGQLRGICRNTASAAPSSPQETVTLSSRKLTTI